MHWRGSAQNLPLGEGGAQSGSSEPICVTDEGGADWYVTFRCFTNGPFAITILPKGGGDMLQENLKRLRQERGLSQEAMAQELHVVRQTVSKWEKGVSHT